MNLALDLMTIRSISSGSLLAPVGRERLNVTAVGHAERSEHRLSGDFRVRSFFDVHDRQLRDGDTASRVAVLRARFEVNTYRRGVGRRGSVQDLLQGRNL